MLQSWYGNIRVCRMIFFLIIILAFFQSQSNLSKSFDGKNCTSNLNVGYFVFLRSEKANIIGQHAEKYVFLHRQANVAQLADHQLPKLRVAGSSPVIRSTAIFRSWCLRVAFLFQELFLRKTIGNLCL